MTIWSICIRPGRNLSKNVPTFFGKLNVDNPVSTASMLSY